MDNSKHEISEDEMAVKLESRYYEIEKDVLKIMYRNFTNELTEGQRKEMGVLAEKERKILECALGLVLGGRLTHEFQRGSVKDEPGAGRLGDMLEKRYDEEEMREAMEMHGGRMVIGFKDGRQPIMGTVDNLEMDEGHERIVKAVISLEGEKGGQAGGKMVVPFDDILSVTEIYFK